MSEIREVFKGFAILILGIIATSLVGTTIGLLVWLISVICTIAIIDIFIKAIVIVLTLIMLLISIYICGYETYEVLARKFNKKS